MGGSPHPWVGMWLSGTTPLGRYVGVWYRSVGLYPSQPRHLVQPQSDCYQVTSWLLNDILTFTVGGEGLRMATVVSVEAQRSWCVCMCVCAA